MKPGWILSWNSGIPKKKKKRKISSQIGSRRMLGMPEELGKDWVSCISFWNSCQFWNNIPRNNNRKEKKIKIINQTQPTLPKEKKKFPKKFHFGVSGNVGKAQNSREEKEPRWVFYFCLSGTAKVWKSSEVCSIPPRIQGKTTKKVGISRCNSHFPAKERK